MLSFEDFFIKKKIDLSVLKTENKPLFEEFKKHYNLMGETSFDHSKKFWFNKLRKSYRLKEEDAKPIIQVIEKKEKADIEVKKSDNEAIKPLGFKPKFKATTVKPQQENKTVEIKQLASEDKENNESTKPLGFKPKFKATAVKPQQENKTVEIKQLASEDKENNESTKPLGFKPKFKATAVKPQQENTIVETKQPTSEDKENDKSIKPLGFKPRFKTK